MPAANAVPARRPTWPRVLGWIVLCLVILLIILYFVVTSQPFFKGVILPRVSSSLHAKVSVASASIHPFSRVDLRQVRVQTTGPEPLFQADEVRLVYSLFAIMRGNYRVDKAIVSSPVIHIVKNADGSSNLDPLMHTNQPGAQPQKPAQPSAQAKAKQKGPSVIEIGNVAVTNGTVQIAQSLADGSHSLTSISNLNFTLKDLRNGQTGKLNLGADIAVDDQVPAPGTSSQLRARADGSYDLTLTQDAKLSAASGSSHINVREATGNLKDAANLLASLDCDITPSDIKQVALKLQQQGNTLAQITANGPFAIARTEGTINIQLSSIDRRLLNLIGAKSGLDFGSTAINSTNQVKFANSGTVITVMGRMAANNFAVKRESVTTPTLNIGADYDVTANRTQNSALLNTLTLDGTQDQQPLLHGELTSPMAVAWGGSTNAVGESAFRLVLTNFDLAKWRAVLGPTIPEAIVNLAANLSAKQGGQALAFDVDSSVFENSHPGGSVKANGNLDLSRKSGRADLTIADLNENVLRPFLAPMLGSNQLVSVDISGKANTQFESTNAASLKGSFQITNLLVRSPKATSVPAPLSAGLQLDASLNNKIADVRRCELDLTPTARATNQLTLTGRVDMSQPTAITGNLKVNADSLDLTSYYDLFSAKTNAPAGGAPQPAPAPPPQEAVAAPNPNAEPPAMHLPLRSFEFDATVGRLYLREVAISDCRTVAKIDNNRITLDPCQLTMNGAPVKATVNLDVGVPGHRYDIVFSADHVPVAPLADSFSTEYAHKAKGDLIANAQIRGAGIRGTSLRANLAAQANLTFTNADIQLSGHKSRLIVNTLASALRLPELSQSPIKWLGANIVASNGIINLTHFQAVSAAFSASSHGTITIANILTNSPINNLPVDVALPPALAQKARLAPSNAGTNAANVDLGPVYKIAGTIGSPKPSPDYKAIAEITARAAVGAVHIGGEAGKILGNFGIGGQQNQQNQGQPNQNQPAQTNNNQGGIGGLLHGILGGHHSGNTNGPR